MAFDCVYLLAQQDEHSSAKNAGKERAETGFRLIWNNYQSTTGGLPNLTEFKKTCTSILKDKKSLTKNVCLAVLMYSFIFVHWHYENIPYKPEAIQDIDII